MSDMVIAGSFREAAEFRAQEGLRPSSIVASREAFRGRRADRIHLLPDFFRRRDVPAWRADLRSLLRRYPKTQILAWGYGDAGFTHEHDIRFEGFEGFLRLEADSTKPEPRAPREPEPVVEQPSDEDLILASTVTAKNDEPENSPESQAEQPTAKPAGKSTAGKSSKKSAKAEADAATSAFGEF